MYKILIALLLSTSLQGAYTEIPDNSKIAKLSPEFAEVKTKKIQLENGLKAIVVSDPLLQKSGAALAVNVGSWDEPSDHPGLAHFTEHMLFMGTKKYPDESEYDRYLSEHGGTSNAYTADDLTAYMFVVDHEHFAGALDRFSQFFKEPLFDPSSVERELKAIDQEYAKNVVDDDFQEYYLLKSLGVAEHPFSRFGMGNIESLKNSSRDDLIAWYQSHYSSDQMYLLVYSKLPLDRSIALVEQDFSAIPKKEFVRDEIPAKALPESLYGKMITIKPTKDLQTLTIRWELPKRFVDMIDTQPQLLVNAVLGDEGAGSLLALLKKEGLAEGIKAGSEDLGGASLLMTLKIELTDEGVKNTDTVLELVFQEIALLKENGVPEYIFNDVQQLEKVKYQLQSHKDLFSELFLLSYMITSEPLETFPEKTYVITSYSPKDIRDLIQHLTPAAAIYTRTVPGYENDAMQSEKWLGARYAIEPIAPEKLTAWGAVTVNPALEFPRKNVFIPTDFKVQEVQAADFPKPHAVVNSEFGKVFYAPDSIYKIPKVSIEFVLHTPKISLNSPRSIVLADFYVKAANEVLKEISYPASRAGLKFSLTRDKDTIRIGLDGFNEKAIPFILTVGEALQRFTISDEQFEKIRKELQRTYSNGAKDPAFMQAEEIFKSVIYKNYPTNAQKLAISKKVHPRHLKLFSKHLFNKLYVQGMVFGNLSEKETKEMTEGFIAALARDPYPVAEQTKPEVVSLKDHASPLVVERNIDVEGNAALLAIDGGALTPHTRAVQQIMNQAIREPFFTELRTKQQTGYLVFNSGLELEKQLYTVFLVQSTTHSARDLLSRYEQFLENYLLSISKGEITEERFKNIKESFILQLQQRPKSYTEMGDLLEKLAFEYDEDFDWIAKRIKAFQELTYEQFLNEVYTTLGKGNKGRLAIAVTGTELEPNLINYRRVKNLKFLQAR